MKKVIQFLALFFCLVFLGGCAADVGTAAVEPTENAKTVEPTMAAETAAPSPSPVLTPNPTEEILDGSNEKACSYYEDPSSIMRYRFVSQAPVITLDPAQFESTAALEEAGYQEFLRKFTSLQKSLDRINALYLHLNLVDGEDGRVPYVNPIVPQVEFDAMITDEELLKEWKTLVADAKLVRNERYHYNDQGTYTGVVDSVQFCVEDGGTLEEIFSDHGNYHYKSPVSVTSFEFSSEEMEARYTALLEKILTLAGEKFNRAYRETANYPYLGNP